MVALPVPCSPAVRLQRALPIVHTYLTAFALAPDFFAKISLTFGDRFDLVHLTTLAQAWAAGDFDQLPPIEVRQSAEINGALGAFAQATQTIYLSEELLTAGGHLAAIASVVLEEIGHFVDCYINEWETPGDEGAIFSALVRGETLSEFDLQQLRAEDDSAVIWLDGRAIVIEQATIAGTNASNTLLGTIDPDLITALDGNDSLTGGLGDDLLDGGQGIDRLVETADVNFSLTDTSLTGLGTDSLISIEQATLTGGDGNNILDASAFSGSVLLNGGSGNDTLIAGVTIGEFSLPQYANSVIAFTSQYGAGSWAATQALGEPNTFRYGDVSTAWAPANRNGTTELLTLGFNTPVFATGATIRETWGNGFVRKVEVVDLSNSFTTVWQGVDPSLPGAPADFLVTWAKTEFLVKGLRITVDTNQNAATWEEIDAVQLQGTVLSTGNTLNGGSGNDTYVVTSAADTINDSSGIDTVQVAFSYTLLDGSNLENLTLTGKAAIDATGNSLDNTLTGNGSSNTLTGNAGNDRLIGKSGKDTLIGGLGDDTYEVDQALDIVIEAADQGIDTIESSITWSLVPAGYEQIEHLILSGSAAINATGNAKQNVLKGNKGNNTLDGSSGNDSLTGGRGNDVLIGGAGKDTLQGNEGVDSFRFNAATEGADTIKDFSTAETDILQIAAAGFGGGLTSGTLPANQFLAAAGAGTATNAIQRFIYDTSSGALFFDADGNNVGSAIVKIATLKGLPTLTNASIAIVS